MSYGPTKALINLSICSLGSSNHLLQRCTAVMSMPSSGSISTSFRVFNLSHFHCSSEFTISITLRCEFDILAQSVILSLNDCSNYYLPSSSKLFCNSMLLAIESSIAIDIFLRHHNLMHEHTLASIWLSIET